MVLSTIRTPRPDSELTDYIYSFIHVKDMATLHSVSFSRPDAAGHRVMGVGGDVDPQVVCKLSYIQLNMWYSSLTIAFL